MNLTLAIMRLCGVLLLYLLLSAVVGGFFAGLTAIVLSLAVLGDLVAAWLAGLLRVLRMVRTSRWPHLFNFILYNR